MPFRVVVLNHIWMDMNPEQAFGHVVFRQPPESHQWGCGFRKSYTSFALIFLTAN
jgi:hypothetical protein